MEEPLISESRKPALKKLIESKQSDFSTYIELIEKQMESSLRDGTHVGKAQPHYRGMDGITIKVATVGDFPEVVYKEGDNAS